MSIRNIINTGMGKTLLLALVFSLVLPILLLIYDTNSNNKSKAFKTAVTLLYVFCMFYLTVFDRGIGENRIYNIKLFWSYAKFGVAQYRWQIYLNVLLFFPFGALQPWAFKHSFMKTIFWGITLSTLFEVCQFLFRLGMCELDDVLHNVIGTMLGYVYWKLIEHRCLFSR